MEIIEGNKIIAEFMGLESGAFKYIEDSCKFHTDWNWLMEVVDKIEGMGNLVKGFEIDGTRCQIWTKERVTTVNTFGGKKIDAVWQAVVEFIQWYQKQT